MAINTRVAFSYGHNITIDNSYLNFMENGVELAAIVEEGSYYLGSFGQAIASALNEVGDNEYTVILDRSTRKFTISSTGNFDLLVTNGSQSAISAYQIVGFNENKTSSNTYEADISSGFIFRPQAPAYQYYPFAHTEKPTQSKVNETTDGNEVESIVYGLKRFMEIQIRFQTDIINQLHIDSDPNGVENLRLFLSYIRQKRRIEFYEDRDNLENFTPCIIESTPGHRDGTGFRIIEMYSKKLANYYETGKLIFREII